MTEDKSPLAHVTSWRVKVLQQCSRAFDFISHAPFHKQCRVVIELTAFQEIVTRSYPVTTSVSAVAQSNLTLCNPMDCSMSGLSITNSQTLLKVMASKLVMKSNHLILCHPHPLPPLIFPRIRVFSNKSVFHIRWPKYWSFSFSISPSNEYSGLISFRID